MPAPGNPAVASIVVDCTDPDPLVSFWTEVLGVGVASSFPGFVWLDRLPGDGPSLAFQQVPETKSVKNRLHLDLAVDDAEAFLTRIEDLGGSRQAAHEIGDFRWTVAADPAGNEFCVFTRGQEA